MTIEVKTDVEYAKPLPEPDATSAVYWKSAADGEFRIQHCPACDHYQHYPRALCTECGATPSWTAHSGNGEVHTFTVIRQYGIKPFRDELPYVVAMIELEGTGGLRVMSNVTDCAPDDVAIGMHVEAYAVLAADGIGIPYFRPRAD
jgi:uncharacterized OB-fold protein